MKKIWSDIKIIPKNLKAILSSSFALMTLIPLLVVAFLLFSHLDPTESRTVRLLNVISVATMASALFGFWLLGRVMRSIVRLAAQAKTITEKNVVQPMEHFDEDNEVGMIISAFNLVMERLGQKIDELQKVNGELKFLSITDELTGLYNYRSFKEFLEREISRSTRKGYAIALLMVDLDDFKIFNDQYGHAAGNEYLKSVATMLQESVRRYDIVTRYGGDEFAIILPETDMETAQVVARRLHEVLASGMVRTSKGTHHFISVSMGVTSRKFGADKTAPETPSLVEAADQALYAAKKRGKGFLEIYRRAS